LPALRRGQKWRATAESGARICSSYDLCPRVTASPPWLRHWTPPSPPPLAPLLPPLAALYSSFPLPPAHGEGGAALGGGGAALDATEAERRGAAAGASRRAAGSHGGVGPPIRVQAGAAQRASGGVAGGGRAGGGVAGGRRASATSVEEDRGKHELETISWFQL